MATQTICDGCGNPSEELERLGIIDPLDYCESCHYAVERFLGDRDRLHEDICAEWANRLNALVEEVREKIPTMRLPDVD